MTTLLVKLFVKNHKETEKQRVRTAYGTLASVVGIICNLFLFAGKLTVALLINSISVMADAFNNLSDSASSIVSLAGIKIAGRPADKEHPFGHGRYEYISALVVAFIILMVGISLFKSSLDKTFHPEKLGFSIITLIILIVSVLVKIWLAFFNRSLGKRINSGLLLATSTDARNDVIVTSVTIFSVVFEKISGITIDGYMGLGVSLFVLYSGFNIAKETLLPLIGQGVEKELYEKITRKVESYEIVAGTHDLIMHNYGPSHVMGTIHVEVCSSLTLDEVHDVIDRIERDVLKEMNIFLVIHTDPIETDNEEINRVKNILEDVIREIEPEAHIHDFRMVHAGEEVNLIFDLVIPHEYKESQTDELVEKISEKMSDRNTKYICNATVERSYILD